MWDELFQGKGMRIIICVVVGILCVGLVKVGLMIEGVIEWLGFEYFLIDFWGFLMLGGEVFFDFLLWEIDVIMGFIKDVNGDGEFVFLDIYIYFLWDDGDLIVDDKIVRNDDFLIMLSFDGLIVGYDLFLVICVVVGDYFLVVGVFGLLLDEILVGIN